MSLRGTRVSSRSNAATTRRHDPTCNGGGIRLKKVPSAPAVESWPVSSKQQRSSGTRDGTILMLWPSEARSHTAPQAPTQSEASLYFTSFSCLSAASRRLGSIVPRRASTKDSGSMTKTLFTARILKFQRSTNSQALRTWTHSSPVTRRERKRWNEVPG